MTNAANLSKLEAVNEILWTIGLDPVNSLASGDPDAELAEAVLDRTSRRIQLRGWKVNTTRNYELSKNTDNQFVLGDDVLKVDTVNPRNRRSVSTPNFSGHIDVVRKRSMDNTKWLLFDVENNSETWANETSLTVDLVYFLDWEHLNPALQEYIWTAAARRFQKGIPQSQVLHAFTQEDEAEALTQAVQEDAENDDESFIKNDPHVNSIAFRYNPGYAR